MHLAGDPAQPLGAVVRGVHRGHHREEHLRGADIRRRLIAANVLLARLQREAVSDVPVGVVRHTHETAGQLAGVLFTARHEAGVRAAEAHRHTEALCGTEAHICAQISGRGEYGRSQEVHAGGDENFAIVAGVDKLLHRFRRSDTAGGARRLDDRPEEVALRQALIDEVCLDNLEVECLCTSTDDRCGLAEEIGVDGDAVGLVLPVDPADHRHRLGRCRALVEHRGSGHFEAGEFGDHRLEVDQCFESSLRDLGLVRGVARVPGGVFEHVTQDHRRGDRVVVPLSDHRHGDGVLVGEGTQFGECLRFGHRLRKRIDTSRKSFAINLVDNHRGKR